MRTKPWIVLISLTIATWAGSGCVQRTLTVTTSPDGADGALVYLNDQEVGRTPFTRKFIWYGTYDVEIRHSGYASIKTTAQIWAPWWQWVPFDLLTEPLPLTDHHVLHYTMLPPNERDVEPDLIIKRGKEEADQLESTRKPLTSKATSHSHHEKPTTQPAK